MKRFIALLLTLLLFCSAALAEPNSSASARQDPASIYGVWTLTAIEVGGVSYDPALLGLQMTLTFAIDGGFISDDGSQVTVSTWSFIDGGIQAGKATLLRQDDFLTLASGGNTLFFTHTEHYDLSLGATPVPTEAPTPVPTLVPSPDAARAPYCGVWELTTIATGGVSLSPASLGLQMTLTLAADGVFLSDDGNQVTESTWQVENGVIHAGNATMTPGEDGRLALVSGGNTLYFTHQTAMPTPTPSPTPMPTATPAPTVPAEMLPYVGTWHLCYCADSSNFGFIGDLRSIGVTATLQLRENRTGRLRMQIDGSTVSDESATWLVVSSGASFGDTSTPITLLTDASGETFLRYGSTTDYLIFHRSETAVWTPAASTGTAADVRYGVTYVCTSCTLDGLTWVLGEEYGDNYLILQENGTCTIVLMGTTETNIPYTLLNGKYYTKFSYDSVTITPTGTGLDMRLSMEDATFHLVPLP
ncbi:MAG: hypothetical protein IKK57_00330 [Clostridia bacterium]|nr:hypothetical protein [Clostridia bacterium]